MRIAVRRFGELKEDFAQRVFKIINNCYERTGDIDLKLVDLYLFENASLMRAFLDKEKKLFFSLQTRYREHIIIRGWKMTIKLTKGFFGKLIVILFLSIVFFGCATAQVTLRAPNSILFAVREDAVASYGDTVKVFLNGQEVATLNRDEYKALHVQPGMYELICLPLKITGADGASARAILRPYRE